MVIDSRPQDQERVENLGPSVLGPSVVTKWKNLGYGLVVTLFLRKYDKEIV